MARPLDDVVREVERHVAFGGWDQPPRLYALVPTDELRAAQPDLELGPPGSLTPVEQEDVPADQPLDEFLARIEWPAEVAGVALVQEILALPPDLTEDVPAESAREWAAAHPERQELRLAVAVLRDGSRSCALRSRAGTPEGGHVHRWLGDPVPPEDDAVLVHPDLAPNLVAALAATLEP
jgi:hypothetical protein